MSSIGILYIHSYSLVDIPQSFTWNSLVQNTFVEGIGRFGLPFFWIMSGFLFFTSFEITWSSYIRKLKNRMISLGIPYLFWSLAGIVTYYILQTYVVPHHHYRRGHIADMSMGKLIHVLLLKPIPYQLWFLLELLKYVLLSPLIYLIVKYGRGIALIVLLGIWVLIDTHTQPYFDTLSTFFFCLGAYLQMYPIRLNGNIRTIFPLLALFWLIADVYLGWAFTFGQFPFLTGILHKFARFTGVGVLWMGYEYFRLSRYTQYPFIVKAVSFSFFLYLFHEPLITIIKQGLEQVLPINTWFMIGIFALSPVITFFITFGVREFLLKYAAGFYALVTGNR